MQEDNDSSTIRHATSSASLQFSREKLRVPRLPGWARIGGGGNGSSPTPCARMLTRRLLPRVAVDLVYVHIKLERQRDGTGARRNKSKFLRCPARSDSLGELSAAFTITGSPDGGSPHLQELQVELAGIGVHVEEPFLRVAHLAKLLSTCVRRHAGIDPAALREGLQVLFDRHEGLYWSLGETRRRESAVTLKQKLWKHRLNGCLVDWLVQLLTSPVQKNDLKVTCPQTGAWQDGKALSGDTVRDGPGSHSLSFVLFFNHVPNDLSSSALQPPGGERTRASILGIDIRNQVDPE
ncbi:hypothetical protein DL768_003148 [Monosporascus sp. mg162]|nr:hypothetical protein DL768_003148 [Monosporascus sp. mg162]